MCSIVRPAKTQISLGIHPVWSASSLSAWRKLGSLATHWAHSEDWSDYAIAQADLRLCWVHMSHCWFCCVAAQIVKFWATSWENLSYVICDQQHLWFCLLESIIPLDAISKISRLASLWTWAGMFQFNLWSHTSRQVFSWCSSNDSQSQYFWGKRNSGSNNRQDIHVYPKYM